MGFLVCCPHEKVGKSQKKEREGGWERKHLQKNPWILKTAHSTFHARVCRLKYHVVIDCLPSGREHSWEWRYLEGSEQPMQAL